MLFNPVNGKCQINLVVKEGVMLKNINLLICIVLALTSCVYGADPVLSDDFNDNSRGSIWERFCLDNENCWVEEINQQLELRATGTGDIAAFYIAKGWVLDPSQDFSIEIDFSHNLISSGYTDVMIVLSHSNDYENNHMQFSASSYNNDPNFYYGLVEDGNQTDELWSERIGNTGVLYVSYDTNLDELYLSHTGYGSSNALKTITGLLKGKWSAKPVCVGIGGSSDNESVTDNEIFLDNFTVQDGNVIDAPVIGCPYSLLGDLNKDCQIDFVDVALMAKNWLVDCNATPGNPACLPQWQAKPPMFTARDQFTGGVIGGKIYVFGGNGNPNGVDLKSTEVYDPATDWANLADNNHNGGSGVEELKGAVVDSNLYVFGACFGINFNEEYNPDTNTWSTLAPKPTNARSFAVVYDGEIYLFGGYDDNDVTEIRTYYDVVEAYDPNTDTWRFVTNMPKAITNVAIATINDKAYLFGGYDPNAGRLLDEVITYDFQTNTWTTTGYQPIPVRKGLVYSSSAPVIDGKVYLIGGFEEGVGEGVISSRVDIYDTVSNTWQIGPSLPLPLDNFVALALNGTIYVIGGNNDPFDSMNRAKAEVISLSIQ